MSIHLQNNNVIRKIHQTGVISVATASVVNKIVAFVCNIVIVRFVTQDEYGIFGAANNVLEIALLVTGLGILSGVMQFASEKRPENEKREYEKFGLIFGLTVDVVLTCILLLYGMLRLHPIKEANYYVLLLAPTVLFHFFFEYCGVLLRSHKSINKYAVLLNVNSITLSLLPCVGAYVLGIQGLVLGRTFAYLMGDAIGWAFTKDELSTFFVTKKLSTLNRKSILRFSGANCVSGALNRLLYLIDTLMISYLVVAPRDVAIYRVGTQIPEALEFIPYSILVAVMPLVIEHNNDPLWLKRWIKKLYLYSLILNTLITAILFFGAHYIVTLFWGRQYIDSVPVFQILSINYLIMASFRQIGTNVLSALRHVKYNMVISIICCIINFIADYFFIKKFGMIGAAYATVLVVVIASLLTFPYVLICVYGRKQK